MTTTAAELRPLLTVKQYRARELRSDVRHEYVHGRAYAMSGESRAHNRIALNIASRLLANARRGPCRVSMEGVRVIAGPEMEYYPDVMVAGGPPPDEPHIETAPSVLVEVLSPSTRRTDRREKNSAYRCIESLDAYVIVYQPERRIEWYARHATTREWHVADVVGNAVITFPCPPGPDGKPVTMTFDEIYEGVELPPPREPRRARTSPGS